jgi:hypothetical protein
MESTVCLVGPNATYVELALEGLTAGQPYVEKNDPVPRHSEIDLSLVFARRDLLRFLKHWRHSCVRHVSFQLNANSGQTFAVAVSHS